MIEGLWLGVPCPVAAGGSCAAGLAAGGLCGAGLGAGGHRLSGPVASRPVAADGEGS